MSLLRAINDCREADELRWMIAALEDDVGAGLVPDLLSGDGYGSGNGRLIYLCGSAPPDTVPF